MLRLEHIYWSTPEGDGILRDVTLEAPTGTLMVITGPNGGGKTTLGRIIAGIEQPASGGIYLDGEDITRLSVTQRAQRGVSFAFQQPVRFKGITVRQLVETAAGKPLPEEELCHVLGSVGLCARDYVDREVNATLSGGEMKRIEIATVLVRPSRLVVFDEPEAGIDLWSFENLIRVFQRLHEDREATLLIISHQERILRIADEIVLLAEGKIQAQGPRAEMLSRVMESGGAQGECPAEGGYCHA